MKIAYGTNVVSTDGVATEAMQVDPNKRRKLYAILSEGLYTDKAMAVIRELMSNAHDSHVAAGNTERAIDLHAPTLAEPYYSVRDYGTGLTADEGRRTILSYLGSDKDDDDRFIGGWGLGSKSPFAYTSHYFIDLYKNGQHWRFDCLRDDAGIPSTALTEEGPTDEPNGVRVTVPTQSGWYEICRFNERLKTYCERTDFNVAIINQDDAAISLDEVRAKTFQLNGATIRVIPSNDDGALSVLYGGFPYPTTAVKGWEEADTDWLKGFRDLWQRCSLQLVANVGDCDFTPSRDTMVSSNKTRGFILAACRAVMDELQGNERLRQAELLAKMEALLPRGEDGKLATHVPVEVLIDAQQQVLGDIAASPLSEFVQPSRLRALWKEPGSSLSVTVQITFGAVTGKTPMWICGTCGGGSPNIYSPAVLITVPLANQLTALCVPRRAKVSDSCIRGGSTYQHALIIATDNRDEFTQRLAQLHLPESMAYHRGFGGWSEVIHLELRKRSSGGSHKLAGEPPSMIVDCRDASNRWEYRSTRTYVMCGDDCPVHCCYELAQILGVTAVFVPSPTFRRRHVGEHANTPLTNLVSIRDPRFREALAGAAALAGSGKLVDLINGLPAAYRHEFARALRLNAVARLYKDGGTAAEFGRNIRWNALTVPGHMGKVKQARDRLDKHASMVKRALANIQVDPLYEAINFRSSDEIPPEYDRIVRRMIRRHCAVVLAENHNATAGEQP